MKKKNEKFKSDFFALAEKYNVPDINKGYYLFCLSGKVVEEPANEELQDLLLTYICGSDSLLSRFACPVPEEESGKEYKYILKNKARLKKAILDEARFAKELEAIKKRKTLPVSIELLKSEREECKKEAEALCGIYLKCFSCSIEECPELHWNLSSFCEVARAFPNLHKIAPFFFYQIMVKHTSRLAKTKGFRFSLKGLWDYKEYQIQKDNGKNYNQYRIYAKLFVALCKQYKADEAVDIQLCRYAFSQSSNMIKWLREFKPFKTNKYQNKLREILHYSIDCYESCVPDEYLFDMVYNVSVQEWERMLGIAGKNEPNYSDFFWEADAVLVDYFKDHDVDYLYDYFINMYRDQKAMREAARKLYEEAELGRLYPDAVPMKCRLLQVHECLERMLDEMLKSGVSKAMRPIIENCEV